MAFLKKSQDLSIPFEDIKLATKNFTTVIGTGGFGHVYKGELSLSGKLTTVAVKRLHHNTSGQGLKEFLTETQLLSRYKHPNIVSFVGFCEDGPEKILIYEYAENGSLDKYLNGSSSLTWKQRLSICIDAAHGLDYLHNHVGKSHRIIHRDIKSANILLDKNGKAMISDFGLSKLGRANEDETYLITNASGTHGYCDPVYIDTGILTKESDVYSFGVVLLEVLCGRLCFLNVDDERRFLPRVARRWRKNKELYEKIDPEMKNQVKQESFDMFSDIAFLCLQDDRNKRPSIRWVVQQLEEALELQIATGNYVKVGPWGGEGGYPWRFDLDGRISKVLIACANIVDSITFFTTSEDGVEQQSDRYGGSGGITNTITFAEDEDIIEVSGTFGEYYGIMLITSLCFHTNKHTYGPFNNEDGKSFSLPVPKGKFIGFFGRHGIFLDSFGVILQP